MLKRIKQILETDAKKLIECEGVEQIEEVKSVEQQKNLQYIEETTHNFRKQ